MPLLNGLQFCFRMNETSGNRVDSVGGLQLSPTGTIGSAAGKFGNAVDIANASRLVATVYNAVYRGAGSFTVACWFNPDTINLGSAYPVIRWNGGGTARDYSLAVSTAGTARFEVTTTTGSVIANTPAGTITTGQWYLLVGWYDATVGTNGTAYIQVNGGDIYSIALTGPRENIDTSTLLAIGQGNYGFTPFGATDGKVDQVCKWSRVLTAAERAELWSDGIGKAFPFVTGIGGEVGWWCPSLDDAGNGTTNLLDLSGNDNRGTLTNMDPATDWVANTSNGGFRALDFDGVNDWVNLGTGSQLNIGQVLSYSFWFNARALANLMLSMWDSVAGVNQRTIIHNFSGNSVRQYWSPDGLSDGTFIISNAVTADTWNHVASIYRSGFRELWVNGTLQSTFSQATIYTGATTSRLAFGALAGRNNDSVSSFFNGNSDDIRLFNRPLLQSEIANLASMRGYQPITSVRRRRNIGNHGL